MYPYETINDKTIDRLNAFLRGEMAAVETYRQALAKFGGIPGITQLEECRVSHERRVSVLRHEIRRLGGEPSVGSGPWGGFARMVEGTARAFGEKAAIAALEEGEDHGVRQYSGDMDEVDGETRSLVKSALLPEQERTHGFVSTLKQMLH